MKVLIIADEGKWLTDGENYTKTADLGEGRRAEEFTEITDAEYKKIVEEKENDGVI